MITREELREIPQLHKAIERKKEQLLYFEEKATSIPSVLPDPNKVQTSPSNNVNKYSDAAVDLAKEIWDDEARLEELQRAASIFIDGLPDGSETERLTIKVLKMRFIKCYTWYEVAELTGYTTRRVTMLAYGAMQSL